MADNPKPKQSTAHKRTPQERARDLQFIQDLYMKGKTHWQITQALNAKFYSANPLDRRMISYDIQKLVEEWKKRSVSEISNRKTIELEKIDNLEREYWDAWERSKDPAKTATQRAGDITQTVRDSDGDPRFLQGVQWCIERRIKLFGLDEPSKAKVTFERMQDDELIALVTTQLAELGLSIGGVEAARVEPGAEDKPS